jgi:hypothetical protein
MSRGNILRARDPKDKARDPGAGRGTIAVPLQHNSHTSFTELSLRRATFALLL